MTNDWNIGTLLSVSSAYWQGCTLQAGVRLEIFSHIGRHSLSATEIAVKAETDERATELILNALAAIGLIDKKASLYTNTQFAETFLVKTSPNYMGHIILHHHHILDGWAQLDTAVATGRPVEKRSYGAEIERESFLMGMFNLAMGLAPQIAKLIDLSKCRHLLDLGGGPGTYAIHFCLANPLLQATIYDRETTKPFAEQTVASFGLSERIQFKSGDFTIDPISGGPYDAAWLSHILHSNGQESCQEIIAKTVAGISPGGIVLIHDFILDNNKDHPEFGALFSLNMLINNPQGRSYSEEEIRAMMQKSGISDIKRYDFSSPNGSAILAGIV